MSVPRRFRLRVFLPVILAVLAVAGFAVAQSSVLIRGGATTNLVAVDANNRLQVAVAATTSTHGSCTCSNTTVGAAATSVPAAALAGRSTIAIAMLTTGQTLYCCSSSTACTTTTGLPVVFNGIYTDNLATATAVSCICSAAGCSVSACECP